MVSKVDSPWFFVEVSKQCVHVGA